MFKLNHPDICVNGEFHVGFNQDSWDIYIYNIYIYIYIYMDSSGRIECEFSPHST